MSAIGKVIKYSREVLDLLSYTFPNLHAELDRADAELAAYNALVKAAREAVENRPPFYSYGDNEAATQMANYIDDLAAALEPFESDGR